MLINSVRIRSSLLTIPRRFGRYQAPGTLFIPHHQRFDENCDPKPQLHPETPRFKDENNPSVKPTGRIADKRPFKFVCKPNRTYWWCSCGHSNAQPFCDGQHKRIIGQTPHYFTNKVQYKPVKLFFDEPTEVWLCMCKQTSEPPYCDGSHNCPEVQSAIRY